jgi:predicted nucleic acid-binding protein
MSVVVDSSVALAWLLPDEGASPFQAYLADAATAPPIVSGLWLYEVTNALTIAARRKRISQAASAEAIDLISSIPVRVVQLGWLDMRAAARIAHETNLSVYDASYLHMARYMDAPLATLDEPMRRAAKRLGIKLASKK